MSLIDDELKYTKEHEWVRMEDDFIAACGLSDHAQDMLTTIVFVEIPEVEYDVKQGEQIAVVESAKALVDILSPLTGTITAVNTELEESPELINSDPYGAGWIFKIDVQRTDELDDLLTSDEYQAFIDTEA